jgi:hypothetical protein
VTITEAVREARVGFSVEKRGLNWVAVHNGMDIVAKGAHAPAAEVVRRRVAGLAAKKMGADLKQIETIMHRATRIEPYAAIRTELAVSIAAAFGGQR